MFNFCLEVAMPSHAATWKILSLAQQRIFEIVKAKKPTTASPSLMHKVHQGAKRLGTFQLLTKNQFDIEVWKLFRSSDLVDEVKSAFGQGNIARGIAIWRRHQFGMVSSSGECCILIRDRPAILRSDC